MQHMSKFYFDVIKKKGKRLLLCCDEHLLEKRYCKVCIVISILECQFCCSWDTKKYLNAKHSQHYVQNVLCFVCVLWSHILKILYQ